MIAEILNGSFKVFDRRDVMTMSCPVFHMVDFVSRKEFLDVFGPIAWGIVILEKGVTFKAVFVLMGAHEYVLQNIHYSKPAISVA